MYAIRSYYVSKIVCGTWLLHQNGRCNRELDETPVEEFGLAGTERVGGA